MSNRAYIASALLAALTLVPAAPAFADGEIQITHAKALAGNVTPGDTAGYPVTLSQPGSYKLASNLFVTTNKIGIQVTSNNVTIDLNGFTIEGSDVAWYGITGGTKAVTVKNGTITRFKYDGINGGTGDYWIVDSMRSVENGRDGMVLGAYALVRSVVVVGNAARGIKSGLSSLFQGNTVSENGGIGIEASGSAVVGNVVNVNGSTGILTAGSSVVGNLINGNVGHGLSAGGVTGYSGNTLVFNNEAGGGSQATGAVVAAHPNACFAACP